MKSMYDGKLTKRIFRAEEDRGRWRNESRIRGTEGIKEFVEKKCPIFMIAKGELGIGVCVYVSVWYVCMCLCMVCVYICVMCMCVYLCNVCLCWYI